MPKKQTVDVYESLNWKCPNCCETTSGPAWLRKGDESQCANCGCRVVIGEQYADCRPLKFEGKKAFA